MRIFPMSKKLKNKLFLEKTESKDNEQSEVLKKYKDLEISELDPDEWMEALEQESKTLKWKISSFFYRFYETCISPKNWADRIKYFFQRRIRGFDDREIWNLDNSFYRWLYPRLKRFTYSKRFGYPEKYGSFEQWRAELVKRTDQLKLIVDYEYDDDLFPVSEKFLTEEEKKEIEQRVKENKTKNKDRLFSILYNTTGYEKCKKDFTLWFCENVDMLWD